MHFWIKICSISRPVQFLLPDVSLNFGAPFVDNFKISGTFPYHFVDHLIMLLLKISWSSLTKHFLDVSWQFLPILFMNLRLFPGHLISSYTISWPLYDNFLPFHDHWRRLKAIFWQFQTICCQFSDYFLAVSRPRLSHFPCKPFLLRKPTISRTIPNSLSSFGPFPDHLTPFRAVSWPFPDHLRPLHDHFRLFPDQFTTIHAVSLPFQDISGPLQ